MNRRAFLSSSAPLFVPRRAFGANDRLKVGVVGLGGRATWLLKNEKFTGADIVALSDCSLPRCDAAASILGAGAKPIIEQDYRRMFERAKPDAVFVETTTHARALIVAQAMMAGIDVYAEKPMTLTIAEGRYLADVAARYKRVLQCGTQQRSIPVNAWMSQKVREGLIGKVRETLVCNFEGPKYWKPQPAQPMPDGLNWDQWCNQTELRPYHQELQRRWAWYWDYDGGGQSWGVSGWGTHAIDQAQCALGLDDTGPVEIYPEGKGGMAMVSMRYANGTLLRMAGVRRPDHSDLGAILYGETGTVEIRRGTLLASDPELLKGAPPDTVEGPGENDWHIQNFFECIRTRKRTNAHVEAAHRATSLCHLVNICRELGRRLEWDPKAERFKSDDEANAKISRPRRKGYELPKIG